MGMLLAAMTLTIGFILTVVPEDYIEGTPEYNEAKSLSNAWINGFTNFVNLSFIGFLLAYIFTLSLLKLRLKRYFLDFYRSQRKQILISAFCLIFSILFKILMRLQKILIPEYLDCINDSIKNDTWFYPLIILFGQIGEYPFLLGSILLSLKSTLNPNN